MLSILGFIVILLPLVIVHELGHYLFARLFNVKAEVFSVGFGPRLWSRQMGETELRLSMIPLGGFVKLLGEDPSQELPPAEAARSLPRQVPWKRFLIFLGGPLFNFIYAAIVFMAMLALGEPQVANVVGRVVTSSPAAIAGFKSGDTIVSIEGHAVTRFDEIIHKISDSPGTLLHFEVERPGVSGRVQLQAKPTDEEGFSIYGEVKPMGSIDGLSPNARSTLAGVSNPKSIVGLAGVKTGDVVVSIQGKPVQSWEELEAQYLDLPVGTDGKIQLGFKNKTVALNDPIRGKAQRQSLATDLGLHSIEMFIDRVVDKSPAQRAGLKKGDRLVGVGKQPAHSFLDLKSLVQQSGEQQGKVPVHYERNGQLVSLDIIPLATNRRDATLRKVVDYTIGVAPIDPSLGYADAKMVIERVWNPVVLVYRGFERMFTVTWRNFVSIKKMITGDVSAGSIGGPILIGKLAGESLNRGLMAFLSLMAVLSIGLGVLNILPVPVLDGGHMMLLTIEMIRRKPLSIRQMEVIQGLGVSVILLLMVFAFRNDLTRLPIFN